MIFLLVFKIYLPPYGCYCWLTMLLWIYIGQWPWTSWKYVCCGTSHLEGETHLAIDCCNLANGTYFEEWKLWVPIIFIYRLTISTDEVAIRLLWLKAYTSLQVLRKSLAVKFTKLYCTSWVLVHINSNCWLVKWDDTLNVVHLDKSVRESQLTSRLERTLDTKLVLCHFYENFLRNIKNWLANILCNKEGSCWPLCTFSSGPHTHNITFTVSLSSSFRCTSKSLNKTCAHVLSLLLYFFGMLICDTRNYCRPKLSQTFHYGTHKTMCYMLNQTLDNTHKFIWGIWWLACRL